MPSDDALNDRDEDVRQARTSAGGRPESNVARHLSELAREMEAEPDFATVMHRIVTATVAELPGATAAAITLVERGKVSSPAHSSELAAKVGQIQSDTGEGPCVDTAREELTIRVDDLAESELWPAFTTHAVKLGIKSLLSFQLFVQEDSMGALDVYSSSVNGFDAHDEETGLLLASHAAIAMSATREVAHLESAMSSCDLIGQAKGILMERYKVDSTRAFDVLARYSQHTNRKLRDISRILVSEGELPDSVDR